MDPAEFKASTLARRYELLCERGQFIASRIYQGFNVHLFVLDGHYIEMWKRLGIEYVEYIEMLMEQRRIEVWLDEPGLRELLPKTH